MSRKRIGEILVEMGTLTFPEVDRILTALARREPGVKFGQLGKKMGLVDDEQILAALAVQMELVPRELQRDLRRVLGELSRPAPKSPLPFLVRPVRTPVDRE